MNNGVISASSALKHKIPQGLAKNNALAVLENPVCIQHLVPQPRAHV
jgi:hypothetical protein